MNYTSLLIDYLGLKHKRNGKELEQRILIQISQ